MNPPAREPLLSAPPGAGAPPDRARWFEAEVHAHDSHLKSWLRGAFPDADAEDIAQESYLRTWLAHLSAPVRSAKAFLFTVARNLALNSCRRLRNSPIIAVPDLAALGVLDNGRDAAEAAAAGDEFALLEEAVAALPPRCREIIILCKIQRVPQREIAARLGIAEVTVQEQVWRGLRRMEAFFIKRGALQPWRNNRGDNRQNK
ncbi:MAG: RNA polymerase sigma factor [Opitutaceae bacterium]|jgi:RNA polymerase sigma-70 factor (ECF subfamily)|nr:RNA polymerase sigma factor [Opitutaceae bacterium]